MGIDPGTTIMGYGMIKIEKSTPQLIDMGVIKLQKIETHPAKLRRIFEQTLELIDKHHPDEMAIEAPFFGKNVQSMLKLGRAQGVAIAAAVYRDVPIVEYSPRKIKMAITGNGSSSKEQVALMLKSIFKLKELPKLLDATDGLAVALCHYFQKVKANGNSVSTSQISSKKSSKKSQSNSWESFIKNNPDKLK
tara:strand:+ start:2789 stop:3364 length:576 start_codon:yes stop_codon:yes gene_type:complete